MLASGSAARAFASLGLRVPAVSIGPQTTAVAREVGLGVVAEAETHDLDGLVARGRAGSLPGAMTRPITFLTDFGLQDDFVGVCRGVMKRIAPDGGDPRHHARDPAAGTCCRARWCSRTRCRTCRPASTSPWSTPPSARDRRVDRAARLRRALYVGPDNGLLIPAAEKLGGIDGA